MTIMQAFADELRLIKLAAKLLPKPQSVAQRRGPQFVSAKALPKGRLTAARKLPIPSGKAGKVTGRLGRFVGRAAKAAILKR